MSEKVPRSLLKLERFVFRPLFVFVTFVLILIALVQVSGRFAVAALDLFDDEINQLLAGQELHLTGLTGDWRGLNPVVEVGQVTFPAGTLHGVEVELDLLESIYRSSWIAHRIKLAAGDLHLDRIAGGWQLRGMQSQGRTFDVMTLLDHSDEITANVAIVLHDADAQATFNAKLAATNRGANHHLSATLRNAAQSGAGVASPEAVLAESVSAIAGSSKSATGEAGSPEGGGLRVEIQRRDSVPWMQQSQTSLSIRGGLEIPSLAVGVRANLNVVHGAWHAVDDQGSGRLRVELNRIEPQGIDVELGAVMDISVVQDQRNWSGVTEEVLLTSAGQQFSAAPIHVSFLGETEAPLALPALFAERTHEPQLRVWLEAVDLTELRQFASVALSRWDPAGRWVEALNVAGQANNLHLFADSELGFGFVTSVSSLAMNGYRGAPTLRNVQGTLWGHDRGMVVQINARDVDMKFPDLFNDTWRFDHIQGFVRAWFGQGYFAMQGTDLKGELSPDVTKLSPGVTKQANSRPETSVAGGFALTRPQERFDQRLTLMIKADQLNLEYGRSFIPLNMPEGLAQWLDEGPRVALLSDARFAYHGQVQVRPGELGRRIEFMTHLDGGVVQYDPAWPLVHELSGNLHTAGTQTKVHVDSARSLQARLQDTTVVLPQNAQHIELSLNARLQGNGGLDFVRNSPLRENLKFVTDSWSAAGTLRIAGDVVIPIREEGPPLAVDLELFPEDFSLSMPDYRTHVEHLDGRGEFHLPHMFSGNFNGQLYGAPASFSASAQDDWLRFDIHGSAAERDVFELTEFDDLGIMQGRFTFDAAVNLALADEDISNIEVTTDLAGLFVDLPGHLHKPADEVALTEIGVQFLPDYQSIRFLYRDTNGWMHADDDAILRGAIGVGTSPPMTEQSDSAITISGVMDEVRLSDWVSDEGDAAVALPLDWQIANLAIGTFYIDELAFRNVRLKGAERGDDVSFSFASQDLTGAVKLPGGDLMSIDLEHVRLPVSEPTLALVKGIELEMPVDPIPTDVARALPQASVHVAQLDLGDESFGEWRFVIHPSDDSILFSPFSANVNGVHIENSRITWDLLNNSSSFQGTIDLDDLAETLPKWDYAPSVQTEEASIEADVKWQGSPANVSLVDVLGDVRFTSKNGRFLQVETAQGGLRIMSLLNLSTILGRIGGDFSDVRGSGVTFKSLDADIHLDQGVMEFRDRLVMNSTASNFEIGGRVDLNNGVLDNEMIVTLPVSESLPWYSAYLALANPLLGLGVLVGERVLRKPIEQLSSAKFRVTGTLEDPQVDWVSIWDKSLRDQSQELPTDQEAGQGTVSPIESGAGLVESGSR